MENEKPDVNGIDALAPGDHLEYEAVPNDFSAGSRLLALCQYPVQRFPPPLLLYALRIHPRIMIGERIYDNPHYRKAIGRVVR